MQEDRPGIAQPQGTPHRDDDTRGTQGESEMGEKQGGTEHDAVLDVAPTIRWEDVKYSKAVRDKITSLRHERWLILARFANPPTVRFCDTAEYYTLQNRLNTVTKELYEITNNPIYNVKQ